MAAQKNTQCGQCEIRYANQEAYLEHVCEVTEYKPTESGSMGSRQEAISAAALERGNARAKLESEGKSRAVAIKETRGLGRVAV